MKSQQSYADFSVVKMNDADLSEIEKTGWASIIDFAILLCFRCKLVKRKRKISFEVKMNIWTIRKGGILLPTFLFKIDVANDALWDS